MSILEIFGNNVRRYRLAIGLSQEEFAEKCGLHRTYVSDIERFRRNVSLENIQKIADALNVQAFKLLVDNYHDKQE